ncbi:hypothetical protein [Sporocytophaga myxococcoides]|uniref:hypothetical protein n=1 Tax=Sporocytophaga myxococcoides TaxID=153721 RepID=UPI0004914C2C|nr:hypothetical protein [Sporocytophaga myxococcoides]
MTGEYDINKAIVKSENVNNTFTVSIPNNRDILQYAVVAKFEKIKGSHEACSYISTLHGNSGEGVYRVNDWPINISGNTSLTCGTKTTLNASSNLDLKYKWKSNASTGSSMTVMLLNTTSYTVTATDVCGTTKSNYAIVNVNPRPFTLTPSTYHDANDF